MSPIVLFLTTVKIPFTSYLVIFFLVYYFLLNYIIIILLNRNPLKFQLLLHPPVFASNLSMVISIGKKYHLWFYCADRIFKKVNFVFAFYFILS